MSIKSVMHVT